jgi:hypothetical protein
MWASWSYIPLTAWRANVSHRQLAWAGAISFTVLELEDRQ